MKRTINIKAILIIIVIPIALLLMWLIGVGIWDLGGKNNPSLWIEIHNQPLLNNFANGLLILFCLEIGVLIMILISYGLYKVFNWIFPKVKSDEIKREN
jgi:hypothetical protein